MKETSIKKNKWEQITTQGYSGSAPIVSLSSHKKVSTLLSGCLLEENMHETKEMQHAKAKHA